MSREVIAGLLKRRAELAGEVDALRRRVAATVADMRRLDAVVRQVDLSYDPAAASRPKRLRGAVVLVQRMGMALRLQELNGALLATREPGAAGALGAGGMSRPVKSARGLLVSSPTMVPVLPAAAGVRPVGRREENRRRRHGRRLHHDRGLEAHGRERGRLHRAARGQGGQREKGEGSHVDFPRGVEG
jgi:hypothetical protein